MALALILLLAASASFEESFRAGLLALQRNDLQAAEANLGTAAKLEPGNGRVWIALAQTHRKLKEFAKADAAASKAATLGASDPLVQSTLATYYAESGELLKAAEAQARYSSLAPQDAAGREKAESLYFQAVQPLLQQQKFGDGIAILNKATQLLKNSAQLELAAGVAYYGMRRFDEAASAFLRTIAIAPEIQQPYLFLGKFLGQVPSRLPEITERFAAYERANPESAAGYLLHAKALNAQSLDPDTARRLLEKAISIDGRDASAHFELGSVLDRMQRYADAAHELQRAIELDPSDAAAHYRLSRLYDRLGQTEAANRERQIHGKLVEAQQEGMKR